MENLEDIRNKRIKFYERELANLAELKRIIGEKVMMYNSNRAQVEIWEKDTLKMIESLKEGK